MTDLKQLIHRDLKHVWHPCAQMKKFEDCPPLIISKAAGSYLYTNKGPLIDAISSWWCKSLGHGHPALIAAIEEQLKSFEHVIAANTTHVKMVEFAEEMARLTRRQHVYFASDGACAVEIAMKLAIQAMQLRGEPEKNQFIALKHAYHGETLGALSVSDLGIYKKPFEGFGVQCTFIESIPYVSGMEDPLWGCSDNHWDVVLKQLELLSDKACALLVEPLIQGGAGMRCYSADFLKKLSAWAKSKNIYLIADEIMTGWGRTGKWLACDHAQIQPDLICLSKGLTSGSIPFSCVMIDDPLYQLFYHESKQSFLHSHTYSGNSLALSAALATIKIIEEEHLLDQAQRLGDFMLYHMNRVATECGTLKNIRSIGAVVAADLMETGISQIGDALYQQALNFGALIRPIGNTLYWLPPLNTNEATIEQLAEITSKSIQAVYSRAATT